MTRNGTSVRLLVLTATLVCGAIVLARASTAEPVPIRASLNSFPMGLGQWHGRRGEPLDQKVLAILGVDEYANLIYTSSGSHQAMIGLYMGYYSSQRQGDAIHSPLNCLPGAGWEPLAKGELTIKVGAGQVTVNRYLIQKGAERMMVLYWYQSHGRVVASEYESKAYMVLDAIRTNRTDAALVRVITPVADHSGGEAAAEADAVDFVQRMFPVLPEYLPS